MTQGIDKQGIRHTGTTHETKYKTGCEEKTWLQDHMLRLEDQKERGREEHQNNSSLLNGRNKNYIQAINL